MKRVIWSVTNDSDSNVTIDLKANTEKEALYEVLNRLGWHLSYREEEDKEDEKEER